MQALIYIKYDLHKTIMQHARMPVSFDLSQIISNLKCEIII